MKERAEEVIKVFTGQYAQHNIGEFLTRGVAANTLDASIQISIEFSTSHTKLLTPLIFASRFNLINVVNYLITKKTDLNAQDSGFVL